MALDREWEVARDVIARADERIDGLRKYGFSFVTTLLTADALALHSLKDSDGGGLPWIGFAVSLIACVLVVTMRLLEKSNELLQTAVAQRARVIERNLGMELSDVVAERFRKERWWRSVNTLYGTFVLIVAIIGAIAGGADDGWSTTIVRWLLLAAAVGISWTFIAWISSQGMSYRRALPDDWSLDRVECAQGDAVRIMYTRFAPSTWPFTADRVIWRATRANADGTTHEQARRCAGGDDLVEADCKVWLWDTSDAAPGLYDIRIGPEGEAWTLRRRVTITSTAQEEQE